MLQLHSIATYFAMQFFQFQSFGWYVINVLKDKFWLNLLEFGFAGTLVTDL